MNNKFRTSPSSCLSGRQTLTSPHQRLIDELITTFTADKLKEFQLYIAYVACSLNQRSNAPITMRELEQQLNCAHSLPTFCQNLKVFETSLDNATVLSL